MKQIAIDKLQPWSENPRDLTESAFYQLIRQLRLGEIENLVALKDGTVLNGNRRLAAYEKVGKKKAMVAEVDFMPTDDGKFALLVDGEPAVHYEEGKQGQPTVFESPEEGMLAIALAANTQVGTWNDKLLEQLTHTNLDADMFQVHMTPGTRIEDLVQAVAPDREQDHNPLGDKADAFINSTIKQIVVYFTNDQFLEIMPRIEAISKKINVKNNTELFYSALDALEAVNEDGEDVENLDTAEA